MVRQICRAGLLVWYPANMQETAHNRPEPRCQLILLLQAVLRPFMDPGLSLSCRKKPSGQTGLEFLIDPRSPVFC